MKDKLKFLYEKIGEGNLIKIAIIAFSLIFILGIGKCICAPPGDCLQDKAIKMTGIREQGGNNMGELVDDALAFCGLRGTRSMWCGAVQYMVHLLCGMTADELPNSPCWSPSWGREDKLVWRNGDAPDLIQKGMTVLLWGKRDGTFRIIHVGWVVWKDRDDNGWYVIYCSGNTRDPENRWNPGDGMHMVKLYLSTIHAIADWQTYTAKYHIVRRGDTVYRICKTYGISQQQLLRLNSIINYTIWEGQELRVS